LHETNVDAKTAKTKKRQKPHKLKKTIANKKHKKPINTAGELKLMSTGT